MLARTLTFRSTPATAPFDTGFVGVGTGISVPDGSGVDWATPGNILNSDNARATTNMSSNGLVSDRLVGHNANFAAVPDGATITQITLRIEKHIQTATDTIIDHTVQLTIDAGVNLISANAASAVAWVSTEATFDYVFTTSLPTAAQIKATGFGGVLKVTRTAGAGASNNARVDAMSIKVEGTS